MLRRCRRNDRARGAVCESERDARAVFLPAICLCVSSLAETGRAYAKVGATRQEQTVAAAAAADDDDFRRAPLRKARPPTPRAHQLAKPAFVFEFSPGDNTLNAHSYLPSSVDARLIRPPGRDYIRQRPVIDDIRRWTTTRWPPVCACSPSAVGHYSHEWGEQMTLSPLQRARG